MRNKTIVKRSQSDDISSLREGIERRVVPVDPVPAERLRETTKNDEHETMIEVLSREVARDE